MIVDLSDGLVVIVDPGNALSEVDKSQVSFWGFEVRNLDARYEASFTEELFKKVTRYLVSQEKEFTLSTAALALQKKLESEFQDFELFKKRAARYKLGKYDKREFNEFRQFTIDKIQRSLKIHQLKAAFHSYVLGNSANFSVPGSGKTTVILTVYEKLRTEEKVNLLFVVGPPSCFGPWRSEFLATLGRVPNTLILAGGIKANRQKHYSKAVGSEAELILTTFQSLLSDKSEVDGFLRQKGINAFLVVDEAHYIKQINGNWASAVLGQAANAKFRSVLTGTPMPKSYSDLFNLFDFLWPQSPPLSSQQKAIIRLNETKGNRHSVVGTLEKEVGPLFYRVRKSDLNLAKQNFVAPTLIEMRKFERLIYDSVLKRIRTFSKKEFVTNIDLVNRLGRGRIIRLRQAISYARLLSTAVVEYDEKLIEEDKDLRQIIRQYDSLETPGKVTKLLQLIKSLQKGNQKVVIWSNFIETIKMIERVLRANKITCKKIYGAVPIEGTAIADEETREKIRDEFIDPSSGLNVLIANPAACAESISLHKTCHHAVYYDLSYNCAQYLQSLDRIHRVGGSETVQANYHFLQYRNTIDKDIKLNIDAKAQKMYELFEKEYPIYSLDMFEDDGDAEAYSRIFLMGSKK